MRANRRSARSHSSGVPMSKNSPAELEPAEPPLGRERGQHVALERRRARRQPAPQPPARTRRARRSPTPAPRCAAILLDEPQHATASRRARRGRALGASANLVAARSRRARRAPSARARAPTDRTSSSVSPFSTSAGPSTWRAASLQRPAGAERLGLDREGEPHAVRGAVAERLTHLIGAVADAQHDVAHAVRASHSSWRARNGRPPSGASGLGRSPKRGRSRVPSPPGEHERLHASASEVEAARAAGSRARAEVRDHLAEQAHQDELDAEQHEARRRTA